MNEKKLHASKLDNSFISSKLFSLKILTNRYQKHYYSFLFFYQFLFQKNNLFPDTGHFIYQNVQNQNVINF